MDPRTFEKIKKRVTEVREEKAIKKLEDIPSTPQVPVVELVALENLKKNPKYRLGLGADIKVQVTLSKPVIVKTGGGEPKLTIQFHRNNQSSTRDAKYYSGSGTTDLIFRYTIVTNDSSREISVPAGSIQVPAGSTIEDKDGRPAKLGHPAADPVLRLEVTDEFEHNIVEDSVTDLSNTKKATLVVEGGHDVSILNHILKLVGSSTGGLVANKVNMTWMPVRGKDNLLEIYERRAEFSSQIAVAFMADPDMWVLEDPHRMIKKYQDIIWTTGYSIENDLYADGNPTSLLPHGTFASHQNRLNCAIQNFVKDIAPDDPGLQAQYYARISTNAALKLRGKDLLEVLKGFCSRKDHLHMCKRIINTVHNDHHPLLTRLISAIRTEIDKQKRLLAKSATTTGSSMKHSKPVRLGP